MRVQENIANSWPKDGGREAPLGSGGVATERREPLPKMWAELEMGLV
jgi:hypothetical protein